MKNNFIKKIYKEFLLKIAFFAIIVPAIFILLNNIVSSVEFQWIYDQSPDLYYELQSLYYSILYSALTWVIVFVAWSALILFQVYKLIKKLDFYTNSLVDSIEKLHDNQVEYINLPKELSEIETKINYIKTNAQKNERLAKENEQRKDELIVYLAHDIKTPLTSMIGYLSILDEIDDMPITQRKKYINIALKKSYRLEDLINELFETARFNSEKIILSKEKINLNLMLEQIIDDFYPTLNELNKKINLNYQSNINLFADPDKLARVFNNLIKNAINYSTPETDIQINISEKQDKIYIEIINKCPQIPEEKLDRIFDNFYRADAARNSSSGGSGLGLAIAKKIVELHDGKIKAKSTKNATTFYLELPKSEN